MGIQNGPEYLDPEPITKRFILIAVAVVVASTLGGHLLAAPRVTEDPSPVNGATFTNRIEGEAIEDGPDPMLDAECGPFDTLDCLLDCRAKGPRAAGASWLAILVGVTCERTGGTKSCLCQWQPVGIGPGGIGMPCFSVGGGS